MMIAITVYCSRLASTICLPNFLFTIVPRVLSPPSRYSFLCSEVHPLVIFSLMARRSKLRVFCFLFFVLFPEKKSLFYPPGYFTMFTFPIKWLFSWIKNESLRENFPSPLQILFHPLLPLLLVRSPVAVTFWDLLHFASKDWRWPSVFCSFCSVSRGASCWGQRFFNLRTCVLFPVSNFSPRLSEWRSPLLSTVSVLLAAPIICLLWGWEKSLLFSESPFSVWAVLQVSQPDGGGLRSASPGVWVPALHWSFWNGYFHPLLFWHFIMEGSLCELSCPIAGTRSPSRVFFPQHSSLNTRSDS